MQEFTGAQYVQIATANAFGLDKETWDIRLDWYAQNKGHLWDCLDKAEEPFMFAKCIHTLDQLEAKEPTGFIMSLDATASGLQIMACVTGCTHTALNTNLVNTNTREDIYLKIANEMNKIPNIQVTRKKVKKPTMTTFYGSKRQPKELFGENTPELQAFYATLEKELPGAMRLMERMQSYWDPTATSYTWKLPDGHVVVAPVYQKIDKKIEVDALRHATFTHRAKVLMPANTGLSLAANIIHSIDGYVVRSMFRKTDELGIQMAAIHDSFWAHPNDMNILRYLYKEIMVEIAESNIMSNILYQISGQKIRYTKISSELPNLIKESEYAIS